MRLEDFFRVIKGWDAPRFVRDAFGTITAMQDWNNVIVPIGGGGGSPSLLGNNLISGGGVAMTSGLNLTVSAATYTIQSAYYSSPQTNLTAAAADPSNPRIDVVIVNSSGAAALITGTPSATPIKPDVDPTTQLELTFFIVAAGATSLNVTTVDVYHENVEYTTTQSGGTITLASTNSPHLGTVCVEGTAVIANNYVQFAAPSSFDPAPFNSLVMYVKSKGTWGTKTLSITFRLTGVKVGLAVTFKHGVFGFDSTNTTTYQQIVIPISSFAAGGLAINQIRMTMTGTGSIGFYLDDITLQKGLAITTTTSGMVWKGNYSATTAYNQYDTVLSGTVQYVCIQANTGNTPASGSVYWQPSTGVPVIGPASAVDSHLVQFDGTTGKLIKDGINLDIDTALTANSDTSIASQKATKAYVDRAVIGPVSATDGHIPQFNGTTGKLIKDGINLDTDTTLAANSDTSIATQKAVKAYVASQIPAASVELKGITFTSDTSSQADSDPGNGLFRWNNATQSSATVLFIDNLTADAVSDTTYFASLPAAGFIDMQQSDDATKWQLWKWTATPTAATGYYKFTVTLQASGGSIATGKTVYFNFSPNPSGGGVAVDVQVFAASASWTKPAGVSVVAVTCIGAGGGGGGGGGIAAGTRRDGGGGGGGGAYVFKQFKAADLGGSEAATVGTGGTGGNGGTTGSGSDGGIGLDSSFGSVPKVTAYGGGLGKGGNTAASGVSGGSGGGTAGPGNPGSTTTVIGGDPAITANVVGSGGQGGGSGLGNGKHAECGGGGGGGAISGNGGASIHGGGGGGCGGAISAANAPFASGGGGRVDGWGYSTGYGIAGAAGLSSSAGATGGNGTDGNSTQAGTGGAGGACNTGGTGGIGGNGGKYGGGGAGGGAGTPTGGKGGNGGDGMVRVVSW